jgi:hypothetical protein
VPKSKNPEDGYCFESQDQIHCVHWWDGDPCCYCHHGLEEQKEGMKIEAEDR